MTTNEQKCPVCECNTCIETGFSNHSLPICQKCGLPYILWEPLQSRIDKAVIAERERIKARLDICFDKNYWVNLQEGSDYSEGFREGYLHAIKDIRDIT